jgi:hypothetical protein
MALQPICDCCGEKMEEYEEFGLVRKVQYCKGCVEHIRQYLGERDEIHTNLAQLWASHVRDLKLAFHHTFPKAKLPDE